MKKALESCDGEKNVRARYEAVSYEFLLPEQIKAIRAQCAIAYVPFGSLEWHSFHNPLGTDSLKAHAICCEAALRHGGIVLPAQFFGVDLGNWGPSGWEGYTLGYYEKNLLSAQALGITRSLVINEWKVIVLVTGHDTNMQRDLLQKAVEEGTKGTSACGFAIMEGELHNNPDPDVPMPQITLESWKASQSRVEKIDPAIPLIMDHAAAWETSVMMYVYPDKVNLDALRCRGVESEEAFTDWPGTMGIFGKNPLKYASAELGKKIVLRMADLIGRKALAFLKKQEIK
jgi:creatinine amidohydrolase/Fe(II)-dependent formamide hydrolase-like protein